jgi:NAD(P)H-hydrate epimerase
VANKRVQFAISDGQLVPAISVAEMLEVERVADEETGPSLLQMMEHAGLELAITALGMLGESWVRAHIIVLAGDGSNGAGGLCAARHLASRGADVMVILGRPLTGVTGVLGEQLRTLREAPARVILWSDAFDIGEADLVIDAISGYSLKEVPTGVTMALIRATHVAAAPVLSLDVPSGIDADNGEAPGVMVQPVRTLALGLPKQGLRFENAGVLLLADLGIPPGVFARAGLAFPSPFGSCSQIELSYPDESSK